MTAAGFFGVRVKINRADGGEINHGLFFSCLRSPCSVAGGGACRLLLCVRVSPDETRGR
jgi:hypothetical protein